MSKIYLGGALRAEMEAKYGIKLARQIWDISQASVDLIDDRIREFGIECDKKNGGISAATSAAKLREYEENREYKIKKWLGKRAQAGKIEPKSLHSKI